MKLRAYLGLSERQQNRLAWLMEVTMVGLFFIGLDRGNTGIIVNTAIGIAVAQLPPLLERDYGITMDPGLTLWLTSAVFLHALGTVGVPGSTVNFYRSVWWWDHLTHALSSSVVAGAGYATTRALDRHSESIYLPPKFMFVFLLMFVMAFGVFWEVIEFSLTLAAEAFGSDAVLTQYGLGDTMLDLVFDAAGATVVAIWGTAHLTDVVGILTDSLDGRQSRKSE
ncbi:hypothetical protein VB773_13770 [Haloarculaceae archaeon H-GB2-1]|nr:hypothetical protein [Haloarculaceae archaeon H-GB1-1]MEA5408531.1 hypothetical protein [Haloarculaceae archaeon H-GB2-1]